MNYEKALKEVGFSVPKTKSEVIGKAILAKGMLNSVRHGTLEATTKCTHACRRIVEEGENAKKADYEMPNLITFGATIESIVALRERYKDALEKFDKYADDHFDIDPDNISEYEIDRLVDLLFKIEKYVS